MRIPFIKMHGLGNDFAVLDDREGLLPPLQPATAQRLADRKRGIGCDQIVLLQASSSANIGADFRMRFFNSDGGEVESCGNASRAVALLHGKPAMVETSGGLIALRPTNGGAQVDMGKPRFGWEDIPLAYAMDTSPMPIGWDGLDKPIAVNVGNPHAVFFVEDSQAVDLASLGPVIETDPVFPERVNVNVASLAGPDKINLRVWERGAGLTLACGTGACATAIAAAKSGLTGRKVTIALPGGEVAIEWLEDDTIQMTGPATEAYRGTFEWDDFA